jgi:exonuclease VII small subunit
LSKACDERLKEAELKIRQLIETENGALKTEAFEPETDDEVES